MGVVCTMRIVPSYRIQPGRFGLWILLVTLLVVASTITRVALLIKSFSDVDLTFTHTIAIFSIGFLYDLVNALYFSLPFVLYLWLLPKRLFMKPGHRYALYAWFFVMTSIIVFNGVAEWLFWDEFHVRFNFIAVDYLVYTTEVIGNITQSYPLGWIIAAIVLLTCIVCLMISSWIDSSSVDDTSLNRRTSFVAFYGVAFALTLFIVRSEYHLFS